MHSLLPPRCRSSVTRTLLYAYANWGGYNKKNATLRGYLTFLYAAVYGPIMFACSSSSAVYILKPNPGEVTHRTQFAQLARSLRFSSLSLSNRKSAAPRSFGDDDDYAMRLMQHIFNFNGAPFNQRTLGATAAERKYANLGQTKTLSIADIRRLIQRTLHATNYSLAGVAVERCVRVRLRFPFETCAHTYKHTRESP